MAEMRLRIEPRRLYLAVAGLAVVALLLGLTTWLFVETYRGGPTQWERAGAIKWVLLHLSLGGENVLATWFSSMLLLVVAVTALACYLSSGGRVRRDDSGRWRGWLVLAALFAVLSLDELGSVHERLGALPALNPIGSDVPGSELEIVLIVVVLGFLVAFARHLRAAGAGTASILLGVALLASAPVFEQFSLRTVGTSAGDVTHVAEELTEVVGILAILTGALDYLIARIRVAPTTAGPPSHLIVHLRASRRALLLGTGALVAVLALVFVLAEPLVRYASRAAEDGIPQNWPASALAALAGLLALMLRSASPPGRERATYLLAALVGIAISAYHGANIEGWVPYMGETAPLILPWLKGVLVGGAAITALGLAARRASPLAAVTALGFPLLLGLAFADGGSIAGPAELAASAALMGSLVSGLGGPIGSGAAISGPETHPPVG